MIAWLSVHNITYTDAHYHVEIAAMTMMNAVDFH